MNQNGAGGVDWYTFTLIQASEVQLATFDVPDSSHLASVVSLSAYAIWQSSDELPLQRRLDYGMAAAQDCKVRLLAQHRAHVILAGGELGQRGGDIECGQRTAGRGHGHRDRHHPGDKLVEDRDDPGGVVVLKRRWARGVGVPPQTS